jgi:hypothetical protein
MNVTGRVSGRHARLPKTHEEVRATFQLAARAMRQVLVDHARHKLAEKRGGEMRHIQLDDDIALTAQQSEEVLAIHEALERLQQLDLRQAQIVEMHYFAGQRR